MLRKSGEAQIIRSPSITGDAESDLTQDPKIAIGLRSFLGRRPAPTLVVEIAFIYDWRQVLQTV